MMLSALPIRAVCCLRLTFPRARSAAYIALALTFVAHAAAESWTGLYVFGDSYSDSGAGYVDGNGPTAVVYLAQGLKVPFTHAKAPERAGKSLNFAVSGAQTGEGEGRKTKEALLGYGMKNQVRDFVALVKNGDVKFDSDRTLFFIAGGLNDRRLPTETTVANLEDEMRQLYDVGARHFFLALLPTKIRQFAAVGIRLNPALAKIPEDFHLENATIQLSHWGEFFDQVMADPARYGIVNTTDACAGRALFDQDATPKGDPETYFFYHEGHPSTAVHRAVGQALITEARAAEPQAPKKP
jgi:phospholipase/lecithinase/hemolysin